MRTADNKIFKMHSLCSDCKSSKTNSGAGLRNSEIKRSMDYVRTEYFFAYLF